MINDQRKIRVAHIITDLDSGGAEWMLFRLLSKTNREEFDPIVISLAPIGIVGARIASLKIPLFTLDMKSGLNVLFPIIKLIKILKQNNIQIIQTWLYHANLIGGLAGWFAGKIPVIWGIRSYILDPKITKKSTLIIFTLLRFLAKWIPVKAIACSNVSKKHHILLGYPEDKMLYIPNGFDIEHFKPCEKEKSPFRKELEIAESTFLIGFTARFDPYKAHDVFLKAANLVSKKYPQVLFVLCGTNMDWENEILVNWIKTNDLLEKVLLIGPRNDIPTVLAGFDLFVSSSRMEAFSVSIGEAMATGLPCIVTNVGDSALIVGDVGIVVPPDDPEELAEAIVTMVGKPVQEREKIGLSSRKHIIMNFELSRIVEEYSNVYKDSIREQDK
ncbi:MAG: glycosyltransferase [Anaerolineaceae bacterium]|nr:glycosyltransferase [Anaerolineaceae bacterium]